MTRCSKWFRLALWSVVAAAACVASPGTAGASEKGTLTVKDNGSVFTADGIRKAEDAFEAVSFQAPTKLAVVTFNKVPDSKRVAFEDAKSGDAKKRFFREWAEEVARSSGKPDVLVFISMEGTHIKAIDDRQTDLKRGFDDKDLHALEQKFVAGFKKSADATDAAAKLARHDSALLDSVNFVADQLKNTTLPANTNGKRVNAPANNAAETKGTGIMTYVCIGIVALLGVWLVVGVVRMMMGGGGGGGGNYGGGGMGGGGGMMGGGGGGLMTGLLGGMLGAVAGNYLYNNFMGGNSHSNDSTGSSGGGYGDSGTTGDTGAGDYSGGGDGGGSDFGDATGGDSGGGDFGGGDSGGGDFGGGGSDFGGGGDSGGGDW